ncbi:MAG TPA: DNA-processing protein DprA [Rhodanobacteraceae bacterium]|nr:DNA-processing protein DprA [Rhodanobacteraceae bacterium]
MSEHDDLRAWLILMRAPGVGAATLRAWLKEAGGDIDGALALARAERRLSPATREWLRLPDAERLDADMAWLDMPGHRLLRCTEADFPPQLDTIADPPAALFVAGRAEWLLRPQIAIVGARGASPAGLANARLFARALAGTGLVITSGLADGIDGVAHAVALETGGATVAVMGTGPDRIYPRRHQNLAATIERDGALVSEFVPGTGPKAGHFPRRNRIIAGLSLGTLVIEASVRSGSLITARLASEQGREVFALPGSIHNPLARGCHRLIRDGAQLVETVDDIIQALQPLALALGNDLARRLEDDAEVNTDKPVDHDPERNRLLDALGHGEPVAVDVLSQRSGLSAQAVSSLLLLLELEGEVAGQAGGRWLRVA